MISYTSSISMKLAGSLITDFMSKCAYRIFKGIARILR